MKALVATACAVIIAGGGWFAIDGALKWKTQREEEQLQVISRDISRCEGNAREYQNRAQGNQPQTPDTDALLIGKVMDCSTDHPETTKLLGEINSKTLHGASEAVEGRSVSHMTMPDKK